MSPYKKSGYHLQKTNETILDILYKFSPPPFDPYPSLIESKQTNLLHTKEKDKVIKGKVIKGLIEFHWNSSLTNSSSKKHAA